MKLNVSVDGITFGTPINEIEVPPGIKAKRPTGLEAWDLAMGGEGLTPSAVTLFTGTPGSGKTTLMLMLASMMAATGYNVVYNTGEESAFQVKMVFDRLNLRHPFAIGQIGRAPDLLEQCDEVRARNPSKPFILIQDSLQVLDDGYFQNGRMTSATPVRSMQMLTDWTKRALEDVPEDVAYPNTIVVGQVNKSGKMSGSNKLKHMVDSLVHMSVETNEDSEWFDHRKMFTEKNRFGGAGMLLFLRMSRKGLILAGKVNDYA